MKAAEIIRCPHARQRTEWRRGVLIFADPRHKSVTIATSFEQYIIIKRTTCSYKVWWTSVQKLRWKQRKRAYFYLYVHPPSPSQCATRSKRLLQQNT